MPSMKLSDISQKSVVILRFGPSGLPTDGLRPAEYFQVTVDPKMFSPSGEFVRFGKSPGDEIMGWQRAEALTIVEVLAEWDDESTPPEIPFGNGGVTQLNSGD